MSGATAIEIGAARLTRVPYFDVAIDPESIGIPLDRVVSSAWAAPTWVTGDQQVLIGQAVWVIESQGHVIAVDPCGAADDFLRTGPEAILHQEAVLGAMTAAGFPPERVDAVVLTHLDGIGMAAVVDELGAWRPAFPAARVVMTETELDALAGGHPARGIDVLRRLIDQGVVDGVPDGHQLTDEVTLQATGGHGPGHAVVRVASGDAAAVLIGHLALSPVVVAGRFPSLHDDADRAEVELGRLVSDSVERGTVLIGPLWPAPGAGRAVLVADEVRLDPVG